MINKKINKTSFILVILSIGVTFLPLNAINQIQSLQHPSEEIFLSSKLQPPFLYHPVTTKNPEAQYFFNLGLAFVYAFNHEAAYRYFKQAAERDPQLAMAYWGMALTLGPNINMDITPEKVKEAFAAIQQALKLAPNATANEQAYIKALSTRYSDDPHPDLKLLAHRYHQAMRNLVAKFPDDLDAATLFAESGLDLNPWNQWTSDGRPQENTLEIVKVLESVIKRDPNHLGANHYYIHAIEGSNHPERALMSANRLRHVNINGHILHMPSHIDMRIGDYESAAQANVRAVAADQAYIQKYGAGGIYPVHYMSHNLYFLTQAYMMEGRFADAKKAADELQAFYTPHFRNMPELEYYQHTPLLPLLRFHRWNEILSLPFRPNPSMLISNAMWYFARALAYASLGEWGPAKEEQKLFQEAWKQLTPDMTYGNNRADQVMTIADHVLNAKIEEVQHRMPLAISFLQKAVAVQDNLRYNEPPDWFFPVRESLGGALLRDQQIKEAEQVFRKELEKNPGNGRALFGLWKSLEAQKRDTDAFWIKMAFEKAWRNSDRPLSTEDL